MLTPDSLWSVLNPGHLLQADFQGIFRPTGHHHACQPLSQGQLLPKTTESLRKGFTPCHLLAKGTLKNLLQHHHSKASILCYIGDKNQRIGLNKHVPGLKKEKDCNSVVPRD